MSMVYQRRAGDASAVAINFFGPSGAGPGRAVKSPCWQSTSIR
ncbi:hypothetical protein BLAT2472_20071 [Burkholderia latens]